MTLQELSKKVRVGLLSRVGFRVDIEYGCKQRVWYMNQYYLLRCKNVAAYKAIRAWQKGRYNRDEHTYTPKQAYQALWAEVKQKNNL